jgi:Heterokaryon incompatibility protein (HET)
MPRNALGDHVCISYAWGPDRVPHALDSRTAMPERTLRVLEATANAFSTNAIWIDALCVPLDEPDRSRCFRNLGTIYAGARMVVVVLSGATQVVMDELDRSGHLSQRALRALENDDWVSRAWTYQELVNAQHVQFISESGRGTPIPAPMLFNAVGEAMEKMRKADGLDQWTFRVHHPRLDGMESLIGDWEISRYAERSAFRVMGAMAGRRVENPDELFYAMTGAIKTDPAGDEDLVLPAAEYFMRVCERKGDFSFVYAGGTRTHPSWRPTPGSLQPVLAWHSDGNAQGGTLTGNELQLDNMFLAARGQLDDPARRFLASALGALGVDTTVPAEGVVPSILESLRRAGFSGSGKWVDLQAGYYFPMRDLPADMNWSVAVSTEIYWTFGSPALVVTLGTIGRVIDAGVFVGRPGDTVVSLSLN